MNSTAEVKSDTAPTASAITLRAIGDTWIKNAVTQSADLPNSAKCLVKGGEQIVISGETPAEQGHVLIQSVEIKKKSGEIAACKLDKLYIFRSHWESSSGAQSQTSTGGQTSASRQTSTGGETFEALATLYTTENTTMEGGPKDRCGQWLGTLENYLDGKAKYVAVAMDRLSLPYGTVIRIPDIDAKLGKKIEFRVVDTGEAFIGKKLSRMDICVGDSQDDIRSTRFAWISQSTFKYEILTRGEVRVGECPKL
jgi:3D (Asp-Asp-Asp) domain-containing protein